MVLLPFCGLPQVGHSPPSPYATTTATPTIPRLVAWCVLTGYSWDGTLTLDLVPSYLTPLPLFPFLLLLWFFLLPRNVVCVLLVGKEVFYFG